MNNGAPNGADFQVYGAEMAHFGVLEGLCAIRAISQGFSPEEMADVNGATPSPEAEMAHFMAQKWRKPQQGEW